MRRRSAARDATAAEGPKLVTEDETADSRYMTSWACCTCFVSSTAEEECNAAAASCRGAIAVEGEDGEERDDKDGGGMEGAAGATVAVE
jgi:hypothetical protein